MALDRMQWFLLNDRTEIIFENLIKNPIFNDNVSNGYNVVNQALISYYHSLVKDGVIQPIKELED